MYFPSDPYVPISRREILNENLKNQKKITKSEKKTKKKKRKNENEFKAVYSTIMRCTRKKNRLKQ